VTSYEPVTERDSEAPAEDLAEQAQPVGPDDEADDLTLPDDPEVDQADATDQRIEVRSADDEEYPG
jgi:hypothetical protein